MEPTVLLTNVAGAAGSKGLTVAVSQVAVDVIASQMRKRGTPDASLRVGIRGGGCSGFSYVIEYHDGPPHERDRVIERVATDGSRVRLVVDPKSLLYLNGSELVWEETLMHRGFKFANPNEKSSCGCGSSFTV
ncbi:MAG TPA: iron-sulfur cluster assembly accessory protein [Polyangiaceae bacterium]|nr:iron-sulfur cluster assembly accessory protein [Polyangiaceae bacterium]